MVKTMETLERDGLVEEVSTANSYQQVEVHIRGVVPLLMHNGALANPLSDGSKAIKLITSKKKKTDEDYEELARLEFFYGLYLNDEEHPVIPGINLEGMMVEGAKKRRQGDSAKAGIIADGDFPLIYDGPKDPERLWKNKNFVDIRKAGVRGSAVMRCRPIFHKWELSFVLSYLPSVVNASEVKDWITIAGRIVGLCDYTPKFGRFDLVSFKAM